jgi:hypothetical protein
VAFECERYISPYFGEPVVVLNDPRVPADNKGSERDVRGLAAARNDGGMHRAQWSAAAFARIKSVLAKA